MTINTDRLIAAIVAANPAINLNCNEIASLYGEGTSYSIISRKLRGPRKLAQALLAEAANDDPTVRMQPSPRTPRTPRTRVAKAKAEPTSSTKKKLQTSKDAKTEIAEDSGDAEAKVESPIKIDSDSDCEIVVKSEDALHDDFFATPTKPPAKFEALDFNKYVDDTPRCGELEEVAKLPVTSWFKDEDEV